MASTPLLLPLVVAALLAVIAVAAFRYNRRPKRYPPGPNLLGFIISNIVHGLGSSKERLKMFVKLHDKYGDVVGITIGPACLVMLSNPDDMLQLFSRPETTARPGYNFFMDDATENSNYGLIFSTGRTWLEQRRFCLRSLREVGFGRRSEENIIMEEVWALSGRLKEMAGRPLQTRLLFNLAVVNALWSMVAGERYDYDDPELVQLIQLIEEFVASLNTASTGAFLIFPALAKIKRKFLLFLSKTTWMDHVREKTFNFLRHQISEHEHTCVEGAPRDFIDIYLEKMRKTKGPSSSFYGNGRDKNAPLLATLVDLFGAGSETTSKTLVWAFFLLANHPSVQDAVVHEISNVVGSREVRLADRPRLPYVEATIQETLRFASTVPFTVPCSASEDLEFKGYVIPKRALLLGNIYAAHTQPTIWGDPQNFRPERFLSADKRTVKRHNAWIPFGTGKRNCIGELLAKDELFLFLANLVSNFKIAMPKDEPVLHSLVGVNECLLVPEPHNIVVYVRK